MGSQVPATEAGPTNGTHAAAALNLHPDVLIVGAGFAGVYGIHHLRKLGLEVLLVDAGAGFGGTWHWNRYPGARVDSETPYYALSIPEVWKDWTWTERFPGHEELREYFAHVDRVLGLSRHALFNVVVVAASFDRRSGRWTVHTRDGRVITCRYLVMATGSSYKRHIPSFAGLHHFQGHLLHSSCWPETAVDVTGKKVCVIGSGATGLQIVQTLGREDCELTACVRTPNTALPMRQRQMTRDEQGPPKSFYESTFRAARQSWGGFPYNTAPKGWHEAAPAARQAFYEDLWSQGGFSFFVSNYADLLHDKEANREIYAFWAHKVRARIRNRVKRDIMAPLEQHHWFCTKRPSLEQDYYETIDRDNVTLIDLRKSNIREFTRTGIVFEDGQQRDFDIVILATGYDNVTGSLIDAGLVDTDGRSLGEKWSGGARTYLGLMVDKMPNMFTIYAAQAPTALSNGPPCVELQIEWVGSAISKMREQGIKYIDAQTAAAEQWGREVQQISDNTLYPETDSWYMGANIPGKHREQLIYLGGLDAYDRITKDALRLWEGFDVVK